MPPRLVLVEGLSGMGKTTTASYLGEYLPASRVFCELDEDAHPIRLGYQFGS
jgi:predicted kinase